MKRRILAFVVVVFVFSLSILTMSVGAANSEEEIVNDENFLIYGYEKEPAPEGFYYAGHYYGNAIVDELVYELITSTVIKLFVPLGNATKIVELIIGSLAGISGIETIINGAEIRSNYVVERYFPEDRGEFPYVQEWCRTTYYFFVEGLDKPVAYEESCGYVPIILPRDA